MRAIQRKSDGKIEIQYPHFVNYSHEYLPINDDWEIVKHQHDYILQEPKALKLGYKVDKSTRHQNGHNFAMGEVRIWKVAPCNRRPRVQGWKVKLLRDGRYIKEGEQFFESLPDALDYGVTL
jgi:hypothetical protein